MSRLHAPHARRSSPLLLATLLLSIALCYAGDYDRQLPKLPLPAPYTTKDLPLMDPIGEPSDMSSSDYSEYNAQYGPHPADYYDDQPLVGAGEIDYTLDPVIAVISFTKTNVDTVQELEKEIAIERAVMAVVEGAAATVTSVSTNC